MWKESTRPLELWNLWIQHDNKQCEWWIASSPSPTGPQQECWLAPAWFCHRDRYKRADKPWPTCICSLFCSKPCNSRRPQKHSKRHWTPSKSKQQNQRAKRIQTHSTTGMQLDYIPLPDIFEVQCRSVQFFFFWPSCAQPLPKSWIVLARPGLSIRCRDIWKTSFSNHEKPTDFTSSHILSNQLWSILIICITWFQQNRFWKQLRDGSHSKVSQLDLRTCPSLGPWIQVPPTSIYYISYQPPRSPSSLLRPSTIAPIRSTSRWGPALPTQDAPLQVKPVQHWKKTSKWSVSLLSTPVFCIQTESNNIK